MLTLASLQAARWCGLIEPRVRSRPGFPIIESCHQGGRSKAAGARRPEHGKFERHLDHWGYATLELYVLFRNHDAGTMNERREHVREIKLPMESEFRFELKAGAPIAIRVKSSRGPFQGPYTSASALPATTWSGRYTPPGQCFGRDLECYVFSQECRAAIYSWESVSAAGKGPGLTPQVLLQATGKTATEYMSEETTMTAYANLHLLEQMRVRAHRSIWQDTRVQTLTNYAVRGPTPAYPLIINLDPGDVRPWFCPVALH